jgi:hypothetical protein
MSDYSANSKFVKQLDEDVIEFIHRKPEDQTDKQFTELALREFELQYNISKPYREFCRKKKISSGTISHWEEIPAVPSSEFRDFLLSSHNKNAEQICLESGNVVTDFGKQPIFQDKRTAELINSANSLLIKSFLFPDVEKIKILLMVPSPKMAPLMDKAIGLEKLRLKFGTSDSLFLISPFGLNIKNLLHGLKQAEKTGEPLALIGITGVIVNFLNACEKEGIKFSLPEKSRICDMEQRRGQFGWCSEEEYFRKCKDIIGVDEDFCINVLWICESSTIYFDNVLKNHFPLVKKVRCKEIPPWTRTTVVDTREFKKLPKGEIGLLRHYDLTNRAFAFAVQTANLGFETGDGFDTIGIWNKRLGETGIDRAVGHPGGKIITKILVHLMRRKLSKIKNIYSRLN